MAVEWYLKAAQQDADAQYYLGNMYGQGKGVAKDVSTAVEWYRKSADQGHAQAQCNLGVVYEHDRGGLPQSDALAEEWYRKAADQGYVDAIKYLKRSGDYTPNSDYSYSNRTKRLKKEQKDNP